MTPGETFTDRDILVGLSKTVDAVQEKINRHDKILRGENGTPGMLEEMRGVKKTTRWLLFLVGTATLAMLGQLSLTYLNYQVNIATVALTQQAAEHAEIAAKKDPRVIVNVPQQKPAEPPSPKKSKPNWPF